jgi:hypothetical protein
MKIDDELIALYRQQIMDQMWHDVWLFKELESPPPTLRQHLRAWFRDLLPR